jgi:hypothetical protein
VPTAGFGPETLPSACMALEPELTETAAGHFAACHFDSPAESAGGRTAQSSPARSQP